MCGELPAGPLVTHTYLFVDQAAALSPDDEPPGPGWPAIYDTSNGDDPRQAINYGLDPDTGIYVHAMEHGIDWERPVSVALIDPDDDGSHVDEFQANAGLRIRGGWSRHSDNPKHAFRFFFREEYGPGELDFPLFGDESDARFDDVDLRTSQNYSWSYKGTTGAVNTMNRDVFSRDLQREMGRPYTRSRYYHLYLDGLGSDEAYYALQGKLPDGGDDPQGEVLVDVDNLIDFMIVIFYGGNFDSPTGSFTGNKGPNNFFCIRDRTDASQGFVFFAHDAEHALHSQAWSPGIGLYENRVNLAGIAGDYRMVVTEFHDFHPQWLHHELTASERYRGRFNERVHEHFFGDGILVEENAAALFRQRADELDVAIIAESARWGDSKSFNEGGRTFRTRDDDWAPTVEDTLDHFFLGLDGTESRTQIVLDQLAAAGLYW